MGYLFSPRLRGAFQQLGLLEIYAAVVVKQLVTTDRRVLVNRPFRRLH